MNERQPTPYADLNTVLRELLAQMQAVLGANFVGLYLQGSFAVGDFDPYSDVDFIAVIAQPLSEDVVAALQAMHKRVYGLDIPWAQHLEGSYFPRAVLRVPPQPGCLLWYLDHGNDFLFQSDHCNTLLVRQVVRGMGIPLAGPDPAGLVDPIAVDALRREMLGTITGWGQQVIDKPDPYNNRFYQAYLVLNYCRMLHDLRRGSPGSKRAGADWARDNLDPRWTGLIDRAEAARPHTDRWHDRPDQDDFAATLAFVQYIMEESRRYAAAQGLA